MHLYSCMLIYRNSQNVLNKRSYNHLNNPKLMPLCYGMYLILACISFQPWQAAISQSNMSTNSVAGRE